MLKRCSILTIPRNAWRPREPENTSTIGFCVKTSTTLQVPVLFQAIAARVEAIAGYTARPTSKSYSCYSHYSPLLRWGGPCVCTVPSALRRVHNCEAGSSKIYNLESRVSRLEAIATRNKKDMRKVVCLAFLRSCLFLRGTKSYDNSKAQK